MTLDYTYFDEAYFQDGAKRGTAYHLYRENVKKSTIYAELAETIQEVFRPRRALEIGCATGIIVRRLNDAGIEAHGIDVSAWAIENREHPNVQLAGAEALPFPDGYFDLVYSVHALEHIPTALLNQAIAEMTRVCPAGAQFHMLPILGEGPYCGDRASVVTALKKDPTHNNLHDRGEWIALFSAQGWCDSQQRAAVFADTETGELSTCQFILARPTLRGGVVDRLAGRNFTRAQLAWGKAREPARSIRLPLGLDDVASMAAPSLPTLVFGEEAIWTDLDSSFPIPMDFLGGRVGLVLCNSSGRTLSFRIALVTEAATGAVGPHVLERWMEAEPGWKMVDIPISELTPLQGEPDPSRIIRCLIGGAERLAKLHAQLILQGAGGSLICFAVEPTEN